MWLKGSAYMHEGPFTSFRYWQLPWIQKSLYFFRHGFLFLPFPFPFPFFLPSPFLFESSSFSAFKTALWSLGLLENATILVGEKRKYTVNLYCIEYYSTLSTPHMQVRKNKQKQNNYPLAAHNLQKTHPPLHRHSSTPQFPPHFPLACCPK